MGSIGSVKACLHCKQQRRCRYRGLCWSCYYCHTIRRQYPVDKRYGAKNIGMRFTGHTLPSGGTTAQPGTEEKLRVLEQRVMAGELLWHPDDVICRDNPHEVEVSCWEVRSTA